MLDKEQTDVLKNQEDAFVWFRELLRKSIILSLLGLT